MKFFKRPVVQLTSLLDLLFIMIFISLLAPPPPPSTPIETSEHQKPSIPLNVNEDQKQQARKKLLMDVSSTDGQSQTGVGSKLKKLFVANMYYGQQANRDKFFETALWVADNEIGLARFRIKLANNTRVIQTQVGEPLTLNDNEKFSKCDPITVTVEKIYQNCDLPFGRKLLIDCQRTGSKRYACVEALSQSQNGKTKDWRWNYDLELISVYDTRFNESNAGDQS